MPRWTRPGPPKNSHGPARQLPRNYYSVSDGFSRACSRSLRSADSLQVSNSLNRVQPLTVQPHASPPSHWSAGGHGPAARGKTAQVYAPTCWAMTRHRTAHLPVWERAGSWGKAPKEGRHGWLVVTCILQLSALSTSTALRRSSISCIMCYETEIT